MSENKTIQSVTKALDILKVVGDSDYGMRLNDIASRLDMKTPATHHLVSTLVEGGFLKREAMRIVLGPEIIRLGRKGNRSAFHDAAAREIQLLFNALPRCVVVLGETGAGAALELTMRMSYEQPNILQRINGQTFHMYANAASLVNLAFMSDERRLTAEDSAPFAEYGRHLWESREKLSEYLLSVKEKGYALCPFDSDLSFRAAAPVFSGKGEFSAALGVSVTTALLKTEDDKKNVIERLLASAKRLNGIN
jgi:IclR family acetate operon transcriptional repressor